MKIKVVKKIDLGAIMLQTSSEDINALKDILEQGGFEIPKIKISIYKNRRGRYKDILLWCKEDRGTCRIIPMFATNYVYELVELEDLKIKIRQKPEVSAF